MGYDREKEGEHTGAVKSDKLPGKRKETEHCQMKGWINKTTREWEKAVPKGRKGSVHPDNKKRNTFSTPCGVYFLAKQIYSVLFAKVLRRQALKNITCEKLSSNVSFQEIVPAESWLFWLFLNVILRAPFSSIALQKYHRGISQNCTN